MSARATGVSADARGGATTPRVAVIIPCHNDGALIETAIRSLEGQEPHELVIVDDGSDDADTQGVLDRLREAGARVIRQENQGVHAARTRALAESSAPYVLTLDADDALLPGAITALADALDEGDLDLVWGDLVVFGHVRARRAVKADVLCPWRLRFVCEIGNSGACLYRRSSVEEIGGWTLPGGWEDWDLWLALAARGMRGARVDRPVAYYRIHRQGVNASAAATGAHERMRVLAARHPQVFSGRMPPVRRVPLLVRLLWPAIARIPIGWSRQQQLMLLVCLISEPRRVSRPWNGPLPD